MVEPSVGSLFLRARDRDRAAAADLVTALSGMVVATVRKSGVLPDAVEDVASSVWLKLFEHADRIDNPDAVAGWLRTTAYNQSMQWHRTQKRHGRPTSEGLADQPIEESGFVDLEENDEARGRMSAIREVWPHLNERCKKIVALKTQVPRLTNKQVANELGVPMGSVGPTYSRCLDKLRALLKGNDSDLG